MEQINKPILVIVENDADSNALSAASANVVRLAKALTTAKIYALSVNPDVDEDRLQAAGADVAFAPNAEGYSSRVPQAVADAALAAIREISQEAGEGEPKEALGAVLGVANYRGRAVASIVASSLGVGGGSDVTDIEVHNGDIVATKSALGGSWLVKFQAANGFPVLALRSGAGMSEGVGSAEISLVHLDPELSQAATSVEVVSSTREARGARASLTDADVVVVGGRGVDGDFTVVEELADALGGAVGATRVACDEGWVSRSAQIGQTGLNIAPKLYIGLGVSGAVHHTCGMLGSQTIVAVVDDPDAPIVEIADFTVIGDVTEVVPQALEALAADA